MIDIMYEWISSSFIQGNEFYENLVSKCSQLYSTQYGTWSHKANYRAGESIKLSAVRIREWLTSEASALYYAIQDDLLVGYAIAIQLDVPKYGVISWVTQLVVHEDFRHQEVAKNLLRSIWGFSDHFAWGIVSANPYAIRALEKTTRRRSDPKRIKHNLRKIISIGCEHIPYIGNDTKAFVTNEVSRINTEFFVDHSKIDEMIDRVVTDTVPWKLGDIDEGWEWLAFTFQDQLPFELSDEEITTMLASSDNIVQNAYRRMDLPEKQPWAANTMHEVDFICRECELSPGSTLLDVGCGQGRHALELAKKGIDVIGIDYLDKSIEAALAKKNEQGITNLDFVVADCRDISLDKKVHTVICLYDVIGTYADNAENLKILKVISSHLEVGGVALLSVMNYELTFARAKKTFKLNEEPNALLSLRPCNIMETTGNVFDADYYLVDTETHVVYRREQFKKGRSLPVEFVVRDRRFTQEEIEEMCRSVGLEIEYSRFVNARDWETGFTATSESSKEILIKCRKIR